jgi:hypothetical protein
MKPPIIVVLNQVSVATARQLMSALPTLAICSANYIATLCQSSGCVPLEF